MEKGVSKLTDRFHGGFTESAAFRGIRLAQVSIVGVKPSRLQAGDLGDGFIEGLGFGAGRDAGAMLAAVQVEQDGQA